MASPTKIEDGGLEMAEDRAHHSVRAVRELVKAEPCAQRVEDTTSILTQKRSTGNRKSSVCSGYPDARRFLTKNESFLPLPIFPLV